VKSSAIPSLPISYSLKLEFLLAAQWWGLTPDEFLERSKAEQAQMVATKRARGIIDYLVSKEQERELKRRRRGA